MDSGLYCVQARGECFLTASSRVLTVLGVCLSRCLLSPASCSYDDIPQSITGNGITDVDLLKSSKSIDQKFLVAV